MELTLKNTKTEPSPITILIASLTLPQAQEWLAETDKVVWIIDNLLDPANLPSLPRAIHYIETRLQHIINLHSGSNT